MIATLTFIVLCLTCYVLLLWWQQHTPSKFGLPGPAGAPIVGNLFELIKNAHRLHDWRLEQSIRYAKNGVWALCVRQGTTIHITDPKDIEHILRLNSNNYVVSNRQIENFTPLFGDYIPNTNGPTWVSQRKAASFLMSRNFLRKTAFPKLLEVSQNLLDQIEKKLDDGYFDIQDMFLRTSLDTICSICVGQDVGALKFGSKSEFAAAFDTLNEQIFRRVLDPFWKIKRFLRISSEKKLAEAAQTLDDFALKVIHDRHKASQKGDIHYQDILSLLISHSVKKNEKPTTRYLRNAIITFIGAGRDSTACLLSWAVYELAKNPDVDEVIYEEIREKFENGCIDKLQFDQTIDMPRLTAVIYETLRLHPPFPTDAKTSVRKDKLPSGTQIPPHTTVNYSPYVIMRWPDLWDDPHTFKIDRWLNDEAFPKVNPFKFVAFSGGARQCLGKNLSILEAKVFLSSLLRKYKFKLSTREVNYDLRISLPIKGGLFVKAVQR